MGGNIGRHENTLDLYRIQKDTLYDQKTVMNDDDKSVNIKAGADYFINSRHTIGVMATTNVSNTEWTSTGTTDKYYNPTNHFEEKLKAFNTVPAKRTNANYNLNYRYADTSGREINAKTLGD